MIPEDNDLEGWTLCTITFYTGNEKGDPWGDTTARKNEDGDFKAKENYTCAIDPKFIAYGSWIEIEDKNGKLHKYFCHDTGSHVVKRVASHARGNDFLVVDIFTRGDAVAENAVFGETARWRFV